MHAPTRSLGAVPFHFHLSAHLLICLQTRYNHQTQCWEKKKRRKKTELIKAVKPSWEPRRHHHHPNQFLNSCSLVAVLERSSMLDCSTPRCLNGTTVSTQPPHRFLHQLHWLPSGGQGVRVFRREFQRKGKKKTNQLRSSVQWQQNEKGNGVHRFQVDVLYMYIYTSTCVCTRTLIRGGASVGAVVRFIHKQHGCGCSEKTGGAHSIPHAHDRSECLLKPQSDVIKSTTVSTYIRICGLLQTRVYIASPCLLGY